MTWRTIDTEREGSVLFVTLNRPDRLNALSGELLGELNKAMDEAEADEGVRAIVLAGAGRAFCSGLDLKDEAQLSMKGPADWEPALTAAFNTIMRFWRSPKPTISAVHGYALAGGCELALACDITIAAQGTLFGEPELRFGAGIVALLLPWLTGPKQAKEILFTGNDRVTAERALAIGLINDVVPRGEHVAAAHAMAKDIATVDPAALRMTKQAVNRSYAVMGMETALAAALDTNIIIESLETPARRQFKEIARKDGLKAAIAWRDARFASTAGPEAYEPDE
jgi:enoyl-CoA hydratase/carnithine racemase